MNEWAEGERVIRWGTRPTTNPSLSGIHRQNPYSAGPTKRAKVANSKNESKNSEQTIFSHACTTFQHCKWNNPKSAYKIKVIFTNRGSIPLQSISPRWQSGLRQQSYDLNGGGSNPASSWCFQYFMWGTQIRSCNACIIWMPHWLNWLKRSAWNSMIMGSNLAWDLFHQKT